MKCPKCQFENPNDIKFCGECGNKLERICPECNYPNPPQFKFCGECGLDLQKPKETLKELSFDEKIDKIQRYLPKGITEKILSQRGKIEGERKQVTVMFCDVVGFTPLVETLGPEEAYNMMDQVYEILIHKVHDYGGTVNEMTGDGVLALFGAPIALEDAPQRAIRSAMAIHRELFKYNEKQKEKILPSLKMRIGINTGPVVVGTLGNDLRVEFKAVGDTVNVASRIESMADPGTTYVSEDTYKITEGFFRYEALGRKTIKGKEASIGVYRVIAPSSRRTRFDVSAERGLTRFVGRQRELELLIDGFERSKKSFGNAVSIVSEAGAGKSRLLYEFRKSVANEDITFLEGKCLSFSKHTAYYPIIELLRAAFGVEEDDKDFEKIKKVKKGLQVLNVDEDAVMVYMLELLSVKDSGFDNTSMSPESKKDRTLEALKLITLKLAALRPLILTFEDLHWVDKNSEECLKNLLENVAGSKIFLLFTFRPDFAPSWGSRSYHSQINLNRLPNRDSLLVASHLLETGEIHSDLEEWILGKTEGVPLFIEEFIKYLKDIEAIEKKDDSCYLRNEIQEIAIPSSIQDIIAARVDTLNETSKSVLQVGSAIEREFSYQLVKQITVLDDDILLTTLSALKEAELIFERGIAPNTIYIFKHALTRDVVYESILTKRKKQLHEDIGNAIEVKYCDQLNEYFGILAEHYFLSENYAKAGKYAGLASKQAGRAVSFIDAITFAKKWVTSLEKLHSTELVEKELIDARTTLGFYNLQMQFWGDTKPAIETVIDLAEKLDYKKRLSQIYALIGVHSLFIEEDNSKAVTYLEKAIQTAEETSNFISLIFSNHFLGHVFVENCEFEKGHHYIKKALEIVEMGNVLWSIAMHKACISLNVYCYQGKIVKGYKLGKEAVALAEESGDIFSKTEAYTNYGVCCLHKGSFGEAEDNLLKGLELSKKANLQGHEFVASHSLGEIYFFAKNYGKASAQYRHAISIEKKGVLGKSYFNLSRLGLAAVTTKEIDIDLELLKSFVTQNKIKRINGGVRRHFCTILLNLDGKHIREVKHWIEQAIEMDKENGLNFELGLDYAVYANVFKRMGNIIKAKKTLGHAIDIFKECGADGWVEKTEKDLALLN